jgi:hypothetical protein
MLNKTSPTAARGLAGSSSSKNNQQATPSHSHNESKKGDEGGSRGQTINASLHNISKTDIILENDDIREDTVYNFIKKVNSSKHDSSKNTTEFSRTIADVCKSFNETTVSNQKEGFYTTTIDIQNDAAIIHQAL